jgi:methionine synthase I (cobalamin-dependent)
MRWSTITWRFRRGLIEGGADLLLIETIFDTLNAKAAIFAVEKLLRPQAAPAGDDLRHHHRRLRPHPVRPDRRGVLEFAAPRQPISFGLNCALGAKAAPVRGELSRIATPSCRPTQRRPAERLRRLRRNARPTWRR